MGKNVVYDYDANLRKKNQVRALGTPDEAWTLFEYDEVGNLIKTTDPRFHVTTFGYDDRNRQIWMDSPIASDRNSSGHTTNWQYDDVGNKTRETRADNAFRSWQYDSMNRLWKAEEWRSNEMATANQTTTYVRDAAGNATTITDTKGAIYGFEYDALSRRVHRTYPPDAAGVSRFEHFWYDAVGNLVVRHNPLAQYQWMTYDNRNRLTSSGWNWGGPTITRTYDGASRLTGVVTNGGETTVSFGYDAANRKIWEDQTVAGYPTRHVETLRNADGNRSGLWASTNGQAHYGLYYEYNQRNQLSRITGGDNSPVASFMFDAAGNMTRRVGEWFYASGTWFTYDDLNRPVTVDQGDANRVFQHNRYQYDKVGREVATWREEDGRGERFWYNVANHLTRVVYKANNAWTSSPSNWGSFRDYNYPPDMLNWTSVNADGNLSLREHNALNQYTNVNRVPISYDGNFNQATNYYGQTFVYNAANQVVGGSIQCTYDGLGRCVRRTVGGVTTLFTYDDWNPIMEWDQGGNQKARNIYGAGADEILGRYDAVHGPLIYKQDKQGNVTFLLDGANRVIEKYTYDAFGRPTVMSWDYGTATWKPPSDRSSFGNRFLFTGREWMAEINAYDYRHRLYDPDLGRFLQTDPTGFDAGDMNLFRYCADDPVNKTDPTGLTPQQDPPQKIMEDNMWESARHFDSSNTSQGTFQERMGGLSMGQMVKNEGEKSSGNSREPNQPGKPDYAIRSIERAYPTKKGGTYYAHVFWRIQLFHYKNQKPLGRGIQFREEIRWSEDVDFKAKGYIRGEQPTRADGSVDDPWKLPFSSAEGRVKTTQTIFVGGRSATWEATVYATPQGEQQRMVDAQQYVQFVPPY